MHPTESNQPLAHRPRRSMALLALLALSASAGLLSACNTVAGAGQDVSSGAHAVTTGAERVKSGL